MVHMKYESCKAYANVWMRPAVGDDGRTYYEYILLYVDDVLVVSEHPKECLQQLGKYFTLKPGSVGAPDKYLGGTVSKVKLPNNVEAWAFSSSQYVQEAVKNVEKHLELPT